MVYYVNRLVFVESVVGRGGGLEFHGLFKISWFLYVNRLVFTISWFIFLRFHGLFYSWFVYVFSIKS